MVVSVPFSPDILKAKATDAFQLSMALVLQDGKEFGLIRDEPAVYDARDGGRLQLTTTVEKYADFYQDTLRAALASLRGPKGEITLKVEFRAVVSGLMEWKARDIAIKAAEAQNLLDAWAKGGVLILVTTRKDGTCQVDWSDVSGLPWPNVMEEKGS